MRNCWIYSSHSVVCNTHTGAVAAQCCADYGQGSGPVHLDGVTCLGSEPTITNCSYSITASRNHQSDVGVHCERRRSEGTYMYVYMYLYIHVCMYICYMSGQCCAHSIEREFSVLIHVYRTTWQYSSGWGLLPVGRPSGDIPVRDLGHHFQSKQKSKWGQGCVPTARICWRWVLHLARLFTCTW